MTGPLFGKLAVVTGAGSGIGRAICRVMARDGATIIAAGNNLNDVQETAKVLGSESSAMEMDVSSHESIKKVLSASLDKYKRPPTIVVNSAGIIRDAYFLKMTEVEFDEVYKTNLKGTFLVMQTFAKSMMKYKVSGSIVNISSIVAKLNNIGQANYAASKSGVLSLTQVGCKEFGRFNIRVNAILPGFIDTQMIEKMPEQTKQKVIENCAMRRIGKPEEIAEVVTFLASDKSSYINGAFIEVTGGLLV